MKRPGFFDVEERLSRLSGLGDQLEAFSRTVGFEVFRPDLDKALAYANGSKSGRPPFDPDAEQSLRRTDGIPDQRPPVFYAFPWSGPVGSGARCQNDLTVS